MLAVNMNGVLGTSPAEGAGEGLRPGAEQGQAPGSFTLDPQLPAQMLHGAWPAELAPAPLAELAHTAPPAGAGVAVEAQGQEAEQPLRQAEELLDSLLLQQQMLLHAQAPAVVASAQAELAPQAPGMQMLAGRQPARNLPGADAGLAASAPAQAAAEPSARAATLAQALDALPVDARVQGAEELLSSTGAGTRPTAEAAAQRPELPGAPVARPLAAEARLHLQGPESRWGEQMLNALRDSVELQLKQNKQQAIIRLDPAELGSLEIRLHQEAGRLQVQIHAAQSDVARLLQQTSERLRHDLATPAFSQIDVQVGSQAQSGQRQPGPFAQAAAEQNPSANPRIEGAEQSASRLRSDVLVSV